MGTAGGGAFVRAAHSFVHSYVDHSLNAIHFDPCLDDSRPCAWYHTRVAGQSGLLNVNVVISTK